MKYPSVNKVLEDVDSRYTLVMVVSKRARQLVDGDKATVDINSNKPVSTSLHELEEGNLEYSSPDADSKE